MAWCIFCCCQRSPPHFNVFHYNRFNRENIHLMLYTFDIYKLTKWFISNWIGERTHTAIITKIIHFQIVRKLVCVIYRLLLLDLFEQLSECEFDHTNGLTWFFYTCKPIQQFPVKCVLSMPTLNESGEYC